MKFLVAVAQFESVLFEKSDNTKKIIRLIERAAQKKVRLLVLPEYSQLGAPELPEQETKDKLLQLAEKIPGNFSDVLMAKAKEHNMYIYLTTQEIEGGKLFNTGIFAAPDGKITKYRKLHLYKTQAFDEQYYYTKGEKYEMLKTELGNIGLMICYDSTFPENGRVLTIMGAQILLIPAAWPKEGGVRWERLIPARAVENQVYVLASGLCGGMYNGNSMIVDYKGNTLAKLGDEEGITTAEIDLESQREWREVTLPYLRDRRPELYKPICQA